MLNVWRGDDPSFLQESIQSITSQTSRPDEFVIVADGPLNDQIETVLSIFSSDITKVVRLPGNRGLAQARNYGLLEMSSEYVLVQDADDISHPQRLEVCRAVIGASPGGVTVLSADMHMFESSSRRIVSTRRAVEDEAQLRKALRFRNPINHPTVMIDRHRFLTTGGYRTIDRLEDYATWAHLLRIPAVSFKFLPLPLVAFRMTDDYYRRRGGVKLLRSEFELQKLLKQTISEPPNFAHKFSRLCFTTSPSSVRKQLDKLLSKKNDLRNVNELSSFLCSSIILRCHTEGDPSS